MFKRFIGGLYMSKRFYRILVGMIVLFVFSYNSPLLFLLLQWALLAFFVFTLIDYLSLFLRRAPITLERITTDRFSNGDQNEVKLRVTSDYPFTLQLELIDEVPVQFQERNFSVKLRVAPGETAEHRYTLRPVERGEYIFNDLHAFVQSPLRLVVRRITRDTPQTVKVLPGYLLLKKFELQAHSSNLTEAGAKKIRKIGHSLEFEQIKDYVNGDDIRSINWKATARKGQLMVNNFTDERSQQIYCIIDKGRVMKMPFEGMSLLDYAINASLILSRVALIKQDRAGLITFDESMGNFLPADRRAAQMTNILETLYNQQTRFRESDYEKLYALIRTRITQRSLIVLFTNFESISGLQRQLPYIRAIARNHLVLVVFFENTELRQLTEQPASDVETLYTKTIAGKFAHEKKLIVKELQQHGVFTILTAPQNLTIDAVNKYLELKARQAI